MEGGTPTGSDSAIENVEDKKKRFPFFQMSEIISFCKYMHLIFGGIGVQTSPKSVLHLNCTLFYGFNYLANVFSCCKNSITSHIIPNLMYICYIYKHVI